MLSQESNPVLVAAIPLFEMFMSHWETLINHPKNLKHMKASIEAGLATMYKQYKKIDHTNVYIIVMCM
jgi:hypothetical protein